MISSVLGGVYDDHEGKFTKYDNRIQDLEQLKRYSDSLRIPLNSSVSLRFYLVLKESRLETTRAKINQKP